MSKYKLIKLYPGYEKLGIKIIPTTTSEECEIFCCLEVNVNNVINPNLSPEFWEKIEEEEKADFEILSLKLADGTILSYKNGLCIHRSDLLSCEETFSLKESLSKLNLEDHIYSVKRLSDGEIFTIGDEATVENRKTRYKITALKQPNNNWIQVVGKSGGNEFYYQLKNVQKLQPKTPLFTTEDGVEIFDKNQKVFSVSECDFKIQNHQDFAWIRTRSTERKYHHFSTKEKAEEFIIYNKPCLSLNDIASDIPFVDFGVLMLKVKQKI